MLERESAFYKAHKAEFQRDYAHRYLIITKDSLFGVFDTIGDAFMAAAQGRLELGKFMLHRPVDDDRVINIPSCWIVDDEKKPLPEPVITVSSGNLVMFPYT
jgi:hypothetical protein